MITREDGSSTDLVIGQCYYFETVTKDWVGILVSIDGPYTVTIKSFSWVADTGRRSEFWATGKAEHMEVEVCNDPERKKMLQWQGIEEWPHGVFTETV